MNNETSKTHGNTQPQVVTTHGSKGPGILDIDAILDGSAPDSQPYVKLDVAALSRDRERYRKQFSTNVKPTGSSVHIAVLVPQQTLWPHNEDLVYDFWGGNARQHAVVQAAIAQWDDVVGFNIRQAADGENPRLRIGFADEANQTMGVGNNVAVLDDGWNVNLRDVQEEGPEQGGEQEIATTLHEFGHILGLFHEHQSPDMLNKSRLNRDAVNEIYGATFGDEVDGQIMNPETNSGTNSRLDRQSIMAYFLPANTDEIGNGFVHNNTLSALDKAYMGIVYPRYPPNNANKQIFEGHLDTIGIIGEARANILAPYQAGNINSVRQRLYAWRPTGVTITAGGAAP